MHIIISVCNVVLSAEILELWLFPVQSCTRQIERRRIWSLRKIKLQLLLSAAAVSIKFLIPVASQQTKTCSGGAWSLSVLLHYLPAPVTIALFVGLWHGYHSDTHSLTKQLWEEIS